MNGLSGKIAVVTGGSSGIGLATAQAFAPAGTRVVIADIEDATKAVEGIKMAGGDAAFVRTDVSKSSDIQALVRATVETDGQLDFAVNNAGIGGPAATTGDYATQNIRINAVCPAFIETPLPEKVGITEGSDAYNAIASLHPMKRLGKPEEPHGLDGVNFWRPCGG